MIGAIVSVNVTFSAAETAPATARPIAISFTGMFIPYQTRGRPAKFLRLESGCQPAPRSARRELGRSARGQRIERGPCFGTLKACQRISAAFAPEQIPSDGPGK